MDSRGDSSLVGIPGDYQRLAVIRSLYADQVAVVIWSQHLQLRVIFLWFLFLFVSVFVAVDAPVSG